MATKDDSDIPESGAVFTFGKSKFADDLPNKFWVKNDKVLQIACGDEHTALVTESGRVFMFGPNDWGQLGLGNDNKAVNKPSCIKSLKHDKSRLVACGRSHTIVSTASGHVYSFGSNSEGQLGIKDSGDLSTPKRIETLPQEELRMLDAGSDCSVALTEDGRVYVWGGNEDGKLGLGQVDNAEEPTLLAMERPAVCVACGYYHTAIVSDDGKLYTMGEADGGKLGLPEDLESTNVPQHVADIADPVKWVACGSSHTVALTESGEVYVFGDGESGQLGLGTEVLSCSKPTLLKLPFKASHVFCGQSFTACISEKGQLYTFGDGRHGKLAHGSGDVFSNQFKPFHSKRFSKFLVDKVACGGCHMIVTARPKALNGVEEDDKEETDEMKKTLVSHPVESFGSPSLTRTLSAREKRREEVSRSFSSELNQTLPPPGQSRIIPSLSATMPALRSSPKPAKEDKVENGFVPHLQNGKISDADSAHGDTEDEDPAQDRHKKKTDKDNGSHRSDGSGRDGDSENEEEDNVDGTNETKKKKKKKKKNGQERRMSQSEKDSSVKEEKEDDSWNDDDDHSDVEAKIENEAVKQLETALMEKDEIKTDEEKDDDGDDSVDKKEEEEEKKGSGKATDDVKRSRGPVPVPRKQKAEDSEDNEEEEDEEKLSDKNEDDKEEELERVESKVEEDLISDKEKEKKSKKDKKKDKEEEEDEIVKEESKLEDEEEEEEEKEDSKKKGKDKKKDKDKKKEKEKDKKKKKGKDEDEEDEKDKDKEDDEKDEKADKKSKDKKKDKNDKKKDKDKEGKGKKEEEEDEEGDDENEKEDKKKDKDKKEKDKKKKKGKGDDKERDENGNTEKPPPKKSRTCAIL